MKRNRNNEKFIFPLCSNSFTDDDLDDSAEAYYAEELQEGNKEEPTEESSPENVIER